MRIERRRNFRYNRWLKKCARAAVPPGSLPDQRRLVDAMVTLMRNAWWMHNANADTTVKADWVQSALWQEHRELYRTAVGTRAGAWLTFLARHGDAPTPPPPTKKGGGVPSWQVHPAGPDGRGMALSLRC